MLEVSVPLVVSAFVHFSQGSSNHHFPLKRSYTAAQIIKMSNMCIIFGNLILDM